MTIVVAVAFAGWLLAYRLMRVAPRPWDAHPVVAAPDREETPAVVSLIAGRLGKYGYQATLLDLAARGWFRLGEPGRGLVTCLLTDNPPAERLTPYERRVLEYLATRAHGRRHVPADALSDGFPRGAEDFMKEFRAEVVADAREGGLAEARLGGGQAFLLCVGAVVLAVLSGVVFHQIRNDNLDVISVFGCLFLCAPPIYDATHAGRPTTVGRSVLEQWRARCAPAAAPSFGGGRLVAYAAALGKAPAAPAVFPRPAEQEPTLTQRSLTWSGQSGQWRQIRIGNPAKREVAGPVTGFFLALGLPAVSFLAIGGTFWAQGATRLQMQAGAVLVVCAGAVVIWLADLRDNAIPDFAEFDGVIIRQWLRDDSDPDSASRKMTPCLAIDDGARETSWAFEVSPEQYARFTAGTLVHVQANPRRNVLRDLRPALATNTPWPASSGEPTESWLPDPADLVTAEDAAEVLGGPVEGLRFDIVGRTVTWHPGGARRPDMTVIVRGARPLGTRTGARHGRPVPGVADGYLLNRAAVAREGSLTVVIGIGGLPRAATEAALDRLLPRAAERLRRAAERRRGAG
jgi:hypothetical protein